MNNQPYQGNAYQGKIIAITGGASGIGKALAQAFCQAGATVAIADINGQGADEIAKACGGFGMRVDVTNEGQLAHFITDVERRLGPIDVFVSNAGMALGDGPSFDAAGAPNDAWNMSWQLNVMSSVYAARHIVPCMRKRGSGAFLIVASAAGLLNHTGGASYAATKHAAVSFAESMAIAHLGDGIKTQCLCPQGVNTPFIKGAEETLKSAGEILEPEDVANMTLNAMQEDRFLITTSPALDKYDMGRVASRDKWLDNMRQLRRHLLGAFL